MSKFPLGPMGVTDPNGVLSAVGVTADDPASG